MSFFGLATTADLKRVAQEVTTALRAYTEQLVDELRPVATGAQRKADAATAEAEMALGAAADAISTASAAMHRGAELQSRLDALEVALAEAEARTTTLANEVAELRKDAAGGMTLRTIREITGTAEEPYVVTEDDHGTVLCAAGSSKSIVRVPWETLPVGLEVVLLNGDGRLCVEGLEDGCVDGLHQWMIAMRLPNGMLYRGPRR